MLYAWLPRSPTPACRASPVPPHAAPQRAALRAFLSRGARCAPPLSLPAARASAASTALSAAHCERPACPRLASLPTPRPCPASCGAHTGTGEVNESGLAAGHPLPMASPLASPRSSRVAPADTLRPVLPTRRARRRSPLLSRVLGMQRLDSAGACTLLLLLRRLSAEEAMSTRLEHDLWCSRSDEFRRRLL